MASEIKVDTISEKTSANGVSIDSVVHKDSAVYPSSADGGALGSASNEWSDLFLADSSVIKFGADQDTTLTHTDGTGLTLNSTNKLCFNDASQFIQGSSATVLSIGATDEIDLTATAVDLNGTLNVSGVATFQSTPVFPDGSLAVDDLDIDGATDIGAAIVDADLFIVDDGAGGTNRKVTASRIKTYAGGAVTAINNASADEIVTIGSTTTELDAESGMKYNGDQLVLSFGTGDAKKHLRVVTADDDITDIAGHRYYGSDDNDHSVINNAGGGGMQLDIGGVANSAENTALLITDAKKIATGGEGAPDVDAGGLTLNHGANDTNVITFKNSDVAHGMTSFMETDTYCEVKKAEDAYGGIKIEAATEQVRAIVLDGRYTTSNTAKTTSGNAPHYIRALKKSGSSAGDMSSDDNILCIAMSSTTRFIFDAEGSFHADVESTTYDEYDDAQLVRAFDLSHKKGVIESKFDKFIAYNHENLADMKLVGREEDGTPNHFINVTKFQQLHNGAIWQQYEKHERLLEAVYDLAKEAVGEEKADAILEKHEVKRLQ
jgi:hypothetical protein